MVKNELSKKVRTGFQKQNKGYANVSMNREKFKFIKNWDSFARDLDQLPREEHVFQEVMSEIQNVKPYIKIRWEEAAWPDLSQEKIQEDLVKAYSTVINTKFKVQLDEDSFKISKCRENGICTVQICISTFPTTLYLLSQKHAQVLATLVQKALKYADASMVQLNIYKPFQSINLVNNSSGSYDSATLRKVNPAHNSSDFVIINIPESSRLLEMEDPESLIQGAHIKKNKVDSFEMINSMVLELHPSSKIGMTFDSGLYHFNYTNRSELCFVCKVPHTNAGMFVFVQEDGIIQSSCKHAQSTDSQGRKRVQPLGMYPLLSRSSSFAFIEDELANEAVGLAEIAQPIFEGRLKKAS